MYDAWGQPIGKNGTLAETLGTLNPFRYRGYVFDEETGMYYLRSRYYNPQWGRFVNEDLFLSRGVYSYCMNSPICMVDTSGKEPTYVSSLSELDECLYQYLLAGGGNISVDEFCENAAGYIGKKYVQMRCSTLLLKQEMVRKDITCLQQSNLSKRLHDVPQIKSSSQPVASCASRTSRRRAGFYSPSTYHTIFQHTTDRRY